tara:strand:- start:99 stop:302 length:204 start_codon:yes stop_codon:yes gene_type:complete
LASTSDDQGESRPKGSYIHLKEVAITTSHAVCHLLHAANSEYLRKACDEIIDKTLDKSTAAMASMKL